MPDLWGVAEIAEALKTDRTTVHGWARDRADFPEPLARLRMGPVWDAEAVREWRRQDVARRRQARAF